MHAYKSIFPIFTVLLFFTVQPVLGQEPEIEIQGNAIEIVSGDTSPNISDNTYFGSLSVAGEVVNKTYFILNTGTDTLNLNGIPVVEILGSNYFSLVSAPDTTIAAGNQSMFQIAFEPQAVGEFVATIIIQNNDTDESPYAFDIQGTGHAVDLLFQNNFEEQVDNMNPALAFSANPMEVLSGDPVTLSWNLSNNATSCLKSGDWSGTLSGAEVSNGNHDVVINSITQDSVFMLQCFNDFGSSDVKTAYVNIILPPVVSVSADPTGIPYGFSSTITWGYTNNPDMCTFSEDWPVDVDINGPFSFQVNNITVDKTFSATCENVAGADSDSATVFVLTTHPVWPSCEGGSAAILGNLEDRSILSNGTSSPSTYDGLFEHFQGMSNTFPWPGQFGDSIHLSLTRNRYVAAQFTTSNIGYDAKFTQAGSGNFEGPNPDGKTVSISECPGDFNVHLGQTRCITNSNTLYWSTNADPGGPPGFFCELEKNTTYYLNIVHSDNSDNNDYQTSDCAFTYCGILGQMSEVTF